MPGVPRFTITDHLVPVPGGTRVTSRVMRPRSAKDRAVLRLVAPMFEAGYRRSTEALRPLISADLAARAAQAAGTEEPDLPPTPGRFARPETAPG
jgi:hypothetical protein